MATATSCAARLDSWLNKGDIFVVMGGNGCARHPDAPLVGLQRLRPHSLYSGETSGTPTRKAAAAQAPLGSLFQGGALWSSLTLAENVRAADCRIHQPAAGPRRRDRCLQAGVSGWPASRTFYRPSSART